MKVDLNAGGDLAIITCGWRYPFRWRTCWRGRIKDLDRSLQSCGIEVWKMLELFTQSQLLCQPPHTLWALLWCHRRSTLCCYGRGSLISMNQFCKNLIFLVKLWFFHLYKWGNSFVRNYHKINSLWVVHMASWPKQEGRITSFHGLFLSSLSFQYPVFRVTTWIFIEKSLSTSLNSDEAFSFWETNLPFQLSSIFLLISCFYRNPHVNRCELFCSTLWREVEEVWVTNSSHEFHICRRNLKATEMGGKRLTSIVCIRQ